MLLLSLFFSSVIFSATDFNIKTTLAYKTETNALLREHSSTGGDSFLFGGGLWFLHEKEYFSSELDLGTSYLSYFANDVLSGLSLVDFNINSKNYAVVGARSINFNLEYLKGGHLTPVVGPFLEYREFKFNIFSMNLEDMWFLKPAFNFDIFKSNNSFFDRTLGEVSLAFVSRIFPETLFYMGIRNGWISHNSTLLGDASYYSVYLSMDGRFTKSTEGGVELEYKYLRYTDNEIFAEPELLIWFKTIISPKSEIKVSFFREAKDSFYSNLFMDIGFSLETRTIFLDSWVFKLDADVRNRKYWNINRRDIAFDSSLGIYYPIYSFRYFQNISLMLKTAFSNKITDAYAITTMGEGPDPAVNYNDFRILIGITNEY